ncbi:hypothetical protein LtaPh_1611251 [Leishmania tarentolae]|uniref:Uncharacterized protein n=1 Tax=Leishmania tarentolae TaxID=5689 RepID=A0A640KCP4_LEITA|nr:hypothetical protein LtaPh_1611251 [Leishmania tarentolae]
MRAPKEVGQRYTHLSASQSPALSRQRSGEATKEHEELFRLLPRCSEDLHRYASESLSLSTSSLSESVRGRLSALPPATSTVAALKGSNHTCTSSSTAFAYFSPMNNICAADGEAALVFWKITDTLPRLASELPIRSSISSADGSRHATIAPRSASTPMSNAFNCASAMAH